MEKRERPTGVTLLSVLLILMALNGVHSVMGSGDELLSGRIAKASAVDFVNVGFRIAYTVCAALAAIALWEMKPWAMYAYVAWGVLLVAGNFIKDCVLLVQDRTDYGWGAVLAGPIIIAVAVGIVGMGLRKSLKKSA